MRDSVGNSFQDNPTRLGKNSAAEKKSYFYVFFSYSFYMTSNFSGFFKTKICVFVSFLMISKFS